MSTAQYEDDQLVDRRSAENGRLGAPRAVVRRPANPAAGGVTIAEVSRALNVPMPTLRSWELRYQIPAVTRIPGRHRRYSEREVHAIRLMRDEVARGTRARMAAQSVLALLALEGPAADFIQRFLISSKRSDSTAIRAALADAADVLGMTECVDGVLLPALRQVGQWWETGGCDLSLERVTTEAARAWIDRTSAFAPPPTRRSPLIFACGPGDLHTVGLEALAMLMRHRGWSCRMLGAHTSTAALTGAVVATGAAGVVIVSHLPTGRRRAVASLDAVHALHIPVFYAGNAFNPPRHREQLPGTYLGIKMSDACAAIDGAFCS